MSAASLLAHVLAVALIVLPLRGKWIYRRLLRDLEARVPNARVRFYAWGIGRKVLLAAAAGAWLTAADQKYPFEFRWADASSSLAWIAYAFVLIAGSTLYFRRRGGAQVRLLQRMAGGLIPSNERERRLFWVFAVVTGVAEELQYRWFLTSYLTAYWDADFVQSFALSSLIFGVAHVYQGPLGVGLTTLVGGLFAYTWWSVGSLWVPIAMHVLIDLRVGFVTTPDRDSE